SIRSTAAMRENSESLLLFFCDLWWRKLAINTLMKRSRLNSQLPLDERNGMWWSRRTLDDDFTGGSRHNGTHGISARNLRLNCSPHTFSSDRSNGNTLAAESAGGVGCVRRRGRQTRTKNPAN